jgi:hypothetical protein
MNKNVSRILTFALLSCAGLVTVYHMVRSAEGSIDFGMLGFIIWAISPMVALGAAAVLLARWFAKVDVYLGSAIASLLVLVFIVWAYGSAQSDPSSTSALAYVFVPLYVYIGGFVVLGSWIAVSLIVRRLSS